MENENQVSHDDSQEKQQSDIIITPCPENPPETVQPMNLAIFLRLKILTVALGTIITGVGGHAFFQSTWNKQYQQARDRADGSGKSVKLEYLFDMKCIFVSITLIVYMLSIVSLMFTFDADYKVGTYNKLEKVFHVTASIFLLIGGAMNIYSANMVLHDKVVEEIEKNNNIEKLLTFDRNINQLYDAKIAAGCFSFANALLYFVTSRFVPA